MRRHTIAIAQTAMIAAALALLVYIAIIATGIYTTQNGPSITDNKSSLAEQTKLDSAMRQQLAASLDYVHKADLNQASLTVPLHDVNLSKNQFILLYDSTLYATKGHIALNMPCDVTSPNVPEFEVLVGRAPDLATLSVGYMPQISSPPDMCVYHGQFGFGDPVTDIVLKNISAKNIRMRQQQVAHNNNDKNNTRIIMGSSEFNQTIQYKPTIHFLRQHGPMVSTEPIFSLLIYTYKDKLLSIW